MRLGSFKVWQIIFTTIVMLCLSIFLYKVLTDNARPKGVYESRIGDIYTFKADSLIVQAENSGCGLGEYVIKSGFGDAFIIEGIEEYDKPVTKRVYFEHKDSGCWVMYENGLRIVLKPIHGN